MAPGGAATGRGGLSLETIISNILAANSYVYFPPKDFHAKRVDEEKCYTRYAKKSFRGIYETNIEIDILLQHAQLFPDCLAIELKWQRTPGTADEKLPYLVENIKTCSPYPTIVVYGGEGFRPGAIRWLRAQVGGNLLHVFDIAQFKSWVLEGNL